MLHLRFAGVEFGFNPALLECMYCPQGPCHPASKVKAAIAVVPTGNVPTLSVANICYNWFTCVFVHLGLPLVGCAEH